MIKSLCSETDTTFCCPICASSLKKPESLYLCEKCGRSFQIKEGIPVFGKNSTFFSWDISKEKMKPALKNIDEVGWQETVLRLQDELPQKAGKIWSRICDPRRWPWIFLLPINSESRVLDLGSGWGNNSIALARNCKEVYSMDTTYLYLKWLKAYAKDQSIKNIIPVHGGDTPHLPFNDNYFDAVAMSGIFEWLGESFSGDPRKSQQMVLNDITRILKPGGCLYLGVENRISYKHFLVRNEDFKVYTYSMAGYKNMLKKAGFGRTTFLNPMPDYSRISQFMPLSESSKTDLFKPLCFDYPNNKWKAVMDAGGANFVPSFSILSSRGPLKNNILQEMVIQVVSSALGSDYGDKGKIVSFKVKDKNTGRIILHLRLKGEGYFLKIDTVTGIEKTLLRSARLAGRLKERTDVPDEIKRLLPQFIKHGTYGKYAYLLEREAQGVRSGTLLSRTRTRQRLTDEAVEILKKLHKSTGEYCSVDDRLFDEYFRQPLLNIKKWLRKTELDKYNPWFVKAEKKLQENFMRKELLLACRHGDFVPNNCLTDLSSGRITAVLDWEFGEERGLPLLDFVSFFNRIDREEMRKTYPQLKFPGYPEIFFNADIRRAAQGYMDDLKIPHEFYEGLVFMWWAKYLEEAYPIYRYLSEWRKQGIFPVMESWDRRWKAGTGYGDDDKEMSCDVSAALV